MSSALAQHICPSVASVQHFPLELFIVWGTSSCPFASCEKSVQYLFFRCPQLSISRTIRIERRIRPRGLFGVLLHNFVEIYLQSLCRTESTLKLAQWQMANGKRHSPQKQENQHTATKSDIWPKTVRQVLLLNFYPQCRKVASCRVVPRALHAKQHQTASRRSAPGQRATERERQKVRESEIGQSW